MNIRGQPLCLNMIDCGLVVEMGESDHVNLVKVLGAFIKRDGNLAGHLMIDAAKKCNANEMDIELFCRGLERIIELDNEKVSVVFGRDSVWVDGMGKGIAQLNILHSGMET